MLVWEVMEISHGRIGIEESSKGHGMTHVLKLANLKPGFPCAAGSLLCGYQNVTRKAIGKRMPSLPTQVLFRRSLSQNLLMFPVHP